MEKNANKIRGYHPVVRFVRFTELADYLNMMSVCKDIIHLDHDVYGVKGISVKKYTCHYFAKYNDYEGWVASFYCNTKDWDRVVAKNMYAILDPVVREEYNQKRYWFWVGES